MWYNAVLAYLHPLEIYVVFFLYENIINTVYRRRIIKLLKSRSFLMELCMGIVEPF